MISKALSESRERLIIFFHNVYNNHEVKIMCLENWKQPIKMECPPRASSEELWLSRSEYNLRMHIQQDYQTQLRTNHSNDHKS